MEVNSRVNYPIKRILVEMGILTTSTSIVSASKCLRLDLRSSSNHEITILFQVSQKPSTIIFSQLTTRYIYIRLQLTINSVSVLILVVVVN